MCLVDSTDILSIFAECCHDSMVKCILVKVLQRISLMHVCFLDWTKVFL